ELSFLQSERGLDVLGRQSRLPELDVRGAETANGLPRAVRIDRHVLRANRDRDCKQQSDEEEGESDGRDATKPEMHELDFQERALWSRDVRRLVVFQRFRASGP